VVWAVALAGARCFTLAEPLSTQMCERVLVELNVGDKPVID